REGQPGEGPAEGRRPQEGGAEEGGEERGQKGGKGREEGRQGGQGREGRKAQGADGAPEADQRLPRPAVLGLRAGGLRRERLVRAGDLAAPGQQEQEGGHGEDHRRLGRLLLGQQADHGLPQERARDGLGGQRGGVRAGGGAGGDRGLHDRPAAGGGAR